MAGLCKLNEEHEMIRAMARKMAKDKLAPRAAEIDREGKFAWDIIEFFRENHILNMRVPVEYGGQGAEAMSCHLVIEEFATECANSAHALADHWLGFHPLEIACSEEQKKRIFPMLGEKLVGFSPTELEAESDVRNLKTKAALKGNNYILNGSKCFCADGAVADYIGIFAQADPEAGFKEMSALFVDENTPGLSI